MGKIPDRRLREILFGSSDKSESDELRTLLNHGLIRKIAPKIYTSILDESPSGIIKRNWYQVISHLYPQAVLSHRSALEFKPTSSGDIYITYTYTEIKKLPGLTIHLFKGNPPLPGDKPFFEDLHVSQEARAYLENFQRARKTKKESKTLSKNELEEKLDTIVRVRGDKALNDLRDKAREIAPKLGMKMEFVTLNRIISDLLATGVSKNLLSPVAKARALGEPYDPEAIKLFEELYMTLAGNIYPAYKDKNKTKKSYRNFAFFESYFSNYIEGTQFEIDEAKEIITTGIPLATRDEDSHDILGTYQMVSDKIELSRLPQSSDDLLQLLKLRHSFLLQARRSKKPGQFKEVNNRAGNTEFVDWKLVPGTLKKSFEWYNLLTDSFAKAAYMMFLVSEVHPFIDGNGRIARVMMNAELTAANLSKIIIPTVFREDYMGALKKLTKLGATDAYLRMLLRAYEFSSTVYGENIQTMEKYLAKADAFKEPKEGKLKIKRSE